MGGREGGREAGREGGKEGEREGGRSHQAERRELPGTTGNLSECRVHSESGDSRGGVTRSTQSH